jgi:hypothetical protein
MAVDTSGSPRGQPLIIVAQVRCDRMLPVDDRASQIIRFARRPTMRQIRYSKECQADHYAINQALGL